MPVAKTFFIRNLVFGFLLLAAAKSKAPGQDSNFPLRPESRILDDGSVFTVEEHRKVGERIEERLDRLQAETGSDILVATATSTTGSSAPEYARQLAAAWLSPDVPGAVLIFDRSRDQIAVSANEPALFVIAEYLFSMIEQTTAGRDDFESAAAKLEFASSNLTALFRKNFGGSELNRNPAIRADAVLSAVVAGSLILLVAVVSVLHNRRNAGKAA